MLLLCLHLPAHSMQIAPLSPRRAVQLWSRHLRLPVGSELWKCYLVGERYPLYSAVSIILDSIFLGLSCRMCAGLCRMRRIHVLAAVRVVYNETP